MYIYIYIYIHVYVYIYIYIYIHIMSILYTCMLYIHMHITTYIYIYIYTSEAFRTGPTRPINEQNMYSTCHGLATQPGSIPSDRFGHRTRGHIPRAVNCAVNCCSTKRDQRPEDYILYQPNPTINQTRGLTCSRKTVVILHVVKLS